MGYKRLFIWVEGEDDERFFNFIIKPIFGEKYDWIKVIQYAKKKPEWRIDFIKSIIDMKADYIYVVDINDMPCVTAKKQQIQNKFKSIDKNKITVVIKEIESWYLAGLSDEETQRFEVSPFKTTNDITKEQFNKLIPKEFKSRTSFMSEILKCFSLKIASRKNKSFNYFVERYKIKGEGETED